MEIRATTRSDIPAVDALLARSYPVLLKDHYPASVLVLAMPLISRAQPKLVTCGTYFGVFEGEDLMAAGGWTPGHPNTGASQNAVGHIRHVVSDPAQIRKGYGRALMEHVLRDARAAGVREMLCQSTRMAVPFYAACGFEVLHEIEITLRAGIVFPAVAMRNSLVHN